MRAILVALVVGGCYSPAPAPGAPCGPGEACPAGQRCVAGYCGGGGGDGDGGGPDVGLIDIDAAIDSAPVCTTWNAHHFAPCSLPTPMGDLVLTKVSGDYTLDTDTGVIKGKMNITVPVTTTVITQVGGPDVLLVSVSNFSLEASTTLDVTGGRPLLIAIDGTANISGDITVNAFFGSPGPGGSQGVTATCDAVPTGNLGADGLPATGGGGGAFQGDGGRGGNGGGFGGTALAIPTVIRGGCGGNGGGAGTGTAGTKGAGGGAIQLSARVAILINNSGSINAGGGAGASGKLALGAGGGGGSGGYIGLDAPSVNVSGVIAANGAGGGGGASDVANGANGNNGNASGNAAVGGAGATTTNVGACGKGGNGSSGGTLIAGNGVASNCGGGGGGGGAGYILVWSPSLNVGGTDSPPVLAGPL